MERRFVRFIALFLIVVMVACPVTAMAAMVDPGGTTIEPQSSNYINSTYAAVKNNSGTVTVQFDIVATGTMTSLGATQIQIKDSTGAVKKTFYSSNTPGMMGTNKMIHAGTVTYNGNANTRYYAVVNFKAKNSTGYDTDIYVTGYSS